MEQDKRTYGWRVHAVIAAATVIVASLVGNLATTPNIPTWYDPLPKPWFTPPNWVFGPVWTVLYALLAWSFYRILRKDPQTPGRSRAIMIFIAQIALNTLWSIVFFGLRSPALGLVVIAPLWASIILNAIAFRRVDPLSAWSFAPYLAWVSFAAILNAAIHQLN